MENFVQSRNHAKGSSYASATMTGTHPKSMSSINRGDITLVPRTCKQYLLCSIKDMYACGEATPVVSMESSGLPFSMRYRKTFSRKGPRLFPLNISRMFRSASSFGSSKPTDAYSSSSRRKCDKSTNPLDTASLGK